MEEIISAISTASGTGGVAIIRASGENVLNNTIITNSFIIAAQQKETCGGIGIPTHEDNGIYSILCSDNNGESVRFTYTLSEGNGIICDNDIVYFDYDNNFTINMQFMSNK